MSDIDFAAWLRVRMDQARIKDSKELVALLANREVLCSPSTVMSWLRSGKHGRVPNPATLPVVMDLLHVSDPADRVYVYELAARVDRSDAA